MQDQIIDVTSIEVVRVDSGAVVTRAIGNNKTATFRLPHAVAMRISEDLRMGMVAYFEANQPTNVVQLRA